MFRYLGSIFSIGINLFIGVVFVSLFTKDDATALVICILVMTCYILFTFSPPGIWLFRCQNSVRKPDEMEAARINPIYKKVYSRAKKKNPSLSANIQWFMHDDDSLNAFACGPNTIGINTGLLIYCDDNEIASILAHEFAHIVHWDTTILTVVIQSNAIVLLIKSIFSVAIRICGGLISLLMGFFSESQWMADIFIMLTKFVDFIFDLYLSLIFRFGMIISLASSRQQEFAADRYAAEIGFASSLISACRKFPESTHDSLVLDVTHLLYGTHPKTCDRIARLQQYIETEQAVKPIRNPNQ